MLSLQNLQYSSIQISYKLRGKPNDKHSLLRLNNKWEGIYFMVLDKTPNIIEIYDFIEIKVSSEKLIPHMSMVSIYNGVLKCLDLFCNFPG